MRTHVDDDGIVGLLGIEAMLSLKEEFADILELQIIAYPQNGILLAPGVTELLRKLFEWEGMYWVVYL